MMSDGLQKASSERMEMVLNNLTSNRFVALFTGFMVTAIIQSSSATTVMVVGFVNAGLMTLSQSIGVIMGANIGTTITGWIVSFFGFKVSMSKTGYSYYWYSNAFVLLKKNIPTSLG
jgi:phosphate:Na+ symporter